jgi:hypothetical protein
VFVVYLLPLQNEFCVCPSPEARAKAQAEALEEEAAAEVADIAGADVEEEDATTGIAAATAEAAADGINPILDTNTLAESTAP